MTLSQLVRAIRNESSDERAELVLRLYLSGTSTNVIRIGDHSPEIARYERIQDAVAKAMEE